MAKKKKAENNEEKLELIKDASMSPLTVAEEITEDMVNENIVEEIPEEPTMEITEEEVIVNETIEEEVEEVVEVTEEVKVPEPVQLKEKTKEQLFLEALTKTPYRVFQNGNLVCSYNPNLVIFTAAKYFEIAGRKYSYDGLEIKY